MKNFKYPGIRPPVWDFPQNSVWNFPDDILQDSGVFNPVQVSSLIAGFNSQEVDSVTEIGSGIDAIESIKGSDIMRQTSDPARPGYITSGDGFRAFDYQTSEWTSIARGLVDPSGDFDIWVVSQSISRTLGLQGVDGGAATEIEVALAGSNGLTQLRLYDDAHSLVTLRQSTPGTGGIYIRRVYRNGNNLGVESVGVAPPQDSNVSASTFDSPASQITYVGRNAALSAFFQSEVRGMYYFDSFLGFSGGTYNNMKLFCNTEHNAVIE